MKLAVLAAALATIWSAGALAADAPPATQLVSMRNIVPYLESRYQGEVVAIAFDDSGDKPAHYHVDLRYAETGISKIDVDARTLRIAARVQPEPQDGWTSLAGATALAATLLRGQVTAAELDSIEGDAPHYDVDVRLASGDIARLKVDPKTQQIGWRTPPVVAD
jgi:uncharacterized membrane protein YkoI